MEALNQERQQSLEIVKKLKAKLMESLRFMQLNSEPDAKDSNSYLNSLVKHNEILQSELERMHAENQTLRNIMLLHQDLNSFKSFENELKEMESEDKKKQLESTKRKTKNTPEG